MAVPVLKMLALENASAGICRYWKMPTLENAVTENAGTGNCRC